MIILLHTSKTMRRPNCDKVRLTQPDLIHKSQELIKLLGQKSIPEIAKLMKTSIKLATVTKENIDSWNADPQNQTMAIDSFVGDIYSGLRSMEFTYAQREYAQDHLRILSGLYGVLKPFDGIMPYRLEMGYKVEDESFKNLYEFWGETIANTLPKNKIIINVSAVEYTKVVLPYVKKNLVVTPRFLTINALTKKPVFVVVHAKIARGAFARWCIVNGLEDNTNLHKFADLGYQYNKFISTPHEPVFVCNNFGGIGLSQRLVKH